MFQTRAVQLYSLISGGPVRGPTTSRLQYQESARNICTGETPVVAAMTTMDERLERFQSRRQELWTPTAARSSSPQCAASRSRSASSSSVVLAQEYPQCPSDVSSVSEYGFCLECVSQTGQVSTADCQGSSPSCNCQASFDQKQARGLKGPDQDSKGGNKMSEGPRGPPEEKQKRPEKQPTRDEEKDKETRPKRTRTPEDWMKTAIARGTGDMSEGRRGTEGQRQACPEDGMREQSPRIAQKRGRRNEQDARGEESKKKRRQSGIKGLRPRRGEPDEETRERRKRKKEKGEENGERDGACRKERERTEGTSRDGQDDKDHILVGLAAQRGSTTPGQQARIQGILTELQNGLQSESAKVDESGSRRYDAWRWDKAKSDKEKNGRPVWLCNCLDREEGWSTTTDLLLPYWGFQETEMKAATKEWDSPHDPGKHLRSTSSTEACDCKRQYNIQKVKLETWLREGDETAGVDLPETLKTATRMMMAVEDLPSGGADSHRRELQQLANR